MDCYEPVTICQLCGDKGFSNALIECEKCNAYSIHRYCLDVLPKTFDEYVTWFCDDCELTKPTLDKSKVLTPGKSIFQSPEVQAQKQLEKKIKKKAKKKLKKRVKGESEGLNKSIANTESSTGQGSPLTNHLIGAHFRDACEGTKGEMQMELYQEDGANSVENTSHFLDHRQSSAEPPVDPVWRESIRVRDKKSKKKLKKKVKDESERVNTSMANAELSKSLGSPPNNHLIETHLGDNCEGTKGERQMEMYQEDRAISVENPSDFLSHGQSSAQPLVDPVWRESLRVRDKKSKKKLKKTVNDESERVNTSMANAELSKSLGSPPNNHLIETHLGDNCEGTKGERQMEMYQEDRAISVENASDILSHGQSSAQPLVDPVWRESLCVRDKKSKKKLKKKVNDESERVNTSMANAELSKSLGSPPNNHLIETHLGDNCEGTKDERQMEMYEEDRAISVENPSDFLSHGQSSAQPLVDPVWRESLHVRDKKSKKKLKKKVKDESERVNTSMANAELSKSLGSPPNNHLIETHLGDNCEGTKGERQMEMYQEDKAISVENPSDFLSHGQSSAQPLVDPIESLRVRDNKAMKNGKKKVEDESECVNKSIANADLSKSQGSPPNNHLINASLEDTREGTKSEMQMELYQGNRAISVENTSYFLDHGHFSAEPLVDPVWRGSLRLTDKKFGTIRLVAHLSSLACSQAKEEAKILPIVISAKLLHRFHVWPKGFDKWGPTDESIAMFFFPARSQENMFELLIEAMISQDLAMITEVKNADLLVFTSLSLPVQYHRVFSKLYLWGVFRGKKTSNIRNAVNFRDGRDIGQMFSPYRRSLASPLSNHAMDRAWEQALDAEK